MVVVTDQVYRETCRSLYEYYRNVVRLERVEAIIPELERQQKVLAQRIAGGIVLLPPSGVANYSGVPAGDVSSPVDRALERAEEWYESLCQRYADGANRLLELELERHELVESTTPIRVVIESLQPEDREIVTMRFDLRLSFYQIGSRLHCSERTIRRRVREVVGSIALSLAGMAVR